MKGEHVLIFIYLAHDFDEYHFPLLSLFQI